MPTVRFNALVPMLLCENVQASIAFYVDVLGFTVRDRLDDVGRSGWASLERGDVRVMLASPSYVPAASKVDERFTQCIHYFYVDDVAALRGAVLAAGAEASPLAVRFYGMKEFEVVDPDGHVLLFAQETSEPPTPE